MQWIDTPESSHISGFAYDPEQSTLFLEFKHKTIYSYQAVPKTVFQSFRIAGSKGKFFHSEIKTHYQCKKTIIDRYGRPDRQTEFQWRHNETE